MLIPIRCTLGVDTFLQSLICHSVSQECSVCYCQPGCLHGGKASHNSKHALVQYCSLPILYSFSQYTSSLTNGIWSSCCISWTWGFPQERLFKPPFMTLPVTMLSMFNTLYWKLSMLRICVDF